MYRVGKIWILRNTALKSGNRDVFLPYMKVLGIDIGGSAIKGAPVDTSTGRLLAGRFKIETPLLLSPGEMADAAGLIAAHFRWKGPVGMGFPGVIHGSTILTSANLDKKFIGCDEHQALWQGHGPSGVAHQ